MPYRARLVWPGMRRAGQCAVQWPSGRPSIQSRGRRQRRRISRGPRASIWLENRRVGHLRDNVLRANFESGSSTTHVSPRKYRRQHRCRHACCCARHSGVGFGPFHQLLPAQYQAKPANDKPIKVIDPPAASRKTGHRGSRHGDPCLALARQPSRPPGPYRIDCVVASCPLRCPFDALAVAPQPTRVLGPSPVVRPSPRAVYGPDGYPSPSPRPTLDFARQAERERIKGPA